MLPDVGLCISLLDILTSTEGAVLYGDGSYYYKSLSSSFLITSRGRTDEGHESGI